MTRLFINRIHQPIAVPHEVTFRLEWRCEVDATCHEDARLKAEEGVERLILKYGLPACILEWVSTQEI